MTIASPDDERWMRAALARAELAQRDADVPIGAVIVRDGVAVAVGENRTVRDQDPTAHAEIVAIRMAAATLRSWRLTGCTLYVTLEPCAMCAGAMVNARLGRLVFGASDAKAGAIVSLYRLAEDARLNHRFTVTAGCAPEASVELLQRFFRALRARGEK